MVTIRSSDGKNGGQRKRYVQGPGAGGSEFLATNSKFAPEKKRCLNERSKKRKPASRIVCLQISQHFVCVCVFFKYRKNSLMSFFFLGLEDRRVPTHANLTNHPPAPPENSSTPRNWLASSVWRCRIRTRKSRRGNRRPRATPGSLEGTLGRADGCCGNDEKFSPKKKGIEKDAVVDGCKKSGL